jgi:hypothetical protein
MGEHIQIPSGEFSLTELERANPQLLPTLVRVKLAAEIANGRIIPSHAEEAFKYRKIGDATPHNSRV